MQKLHTYSVKYDKTEKKVMKELVIGGFYRHYKGNLYKVIGVAKHSETLEEMVVYEPQYEGSGLWVRPKAMFMENVVIDGKVMPRFAFEKEE